MSSHPVDAPAWTPKGPHCDNCGKSVSKDVIRIYGQDGTIPRCSACFVPIHGEPYVSDAHAVGRYLRGEL